MNCAKTAGVLLPLGLVILSGCVSSSSESVAIPTVSAIQVASAAMHELDADADGRLTAAEATACPALDATFASWDGNHDGGIATEELRARLERIFMGGAPLTNVSCTITNGRQLLPNVVVEFEPETFTGSGLLPASGTTDSAGRAVVGVAEDMLPPVQRGTQMCQVGVYRVKLSGAGLPVDLREAGCVVDQTARGGTDILIDIAKLK